LDEDAAFFNPPASQRRTTAVYSRLAVRYRSSQARLCGRQLCELMNEK
jgi:hypothetical protein